MPCYMILMLCMQFAFIIQKPIDFCPNYSVLIKLKRNFILKVLSYLPFTLETSINSSPRRHL